MKLEHTIRLLAGTLTFTGLALGWFVDHGWFFLTLFVSLNLIQSSFTKWCPAESLLRKFVYTRTHTS